jgi:uncharacterized membrane protein
MDGSDILLVAIVLLLFASPALAISAFVRMRRLEKTAGPDPKLIARVYALEKRLAEMERQQSAAHGADAPPAAAAPPRVAVLPSAPVSPPARPPGAEGAAPPVFRQPAPDIPPIPFSPQPAARDRYLDLETLIAGRWLNRIGILALLLSVSFFLKYAFDNNWVGARGRVAIGLISGSALLPWSGWLLRRGYQYFSEGIAGLGAAVLYLSLWAGWHYYKLFTSGEAFVGMIVVTFAMAAVALGRNSQRIALLALAGGFLTPQLVSTGKDQQAVLFTYLAVLAAAMLALARARDWQLLAPLSFLAVQIYFWGWYDSFYTPEKLLRTALFATLFFILFAALPVVRSRREGRLTGAEIVIVLLNAFAYLLALRAMLWPEHRWTLTVAVLALSYVHLLVAQSVPSPDKREQPTLKLLFAGLALTFVTLAIPIRLDGKWITIAWAVEGAVLQWSGLRAKSLPLRAAGYVLFSIAAFRLVAFPIPAESFLLNARFAAYAVVVASYAAALGFARRQLAEIREAEGSLLALLGVATNVFALAALSLEAWDLFARMETLGLSRSLAQQLALSMVWTLYATGLLLVGMKRASAMLRWQALALFGIVVGKVFLFDLSFLDRFYRIVSFLVLGAVLLGVSFFYQRKLAAGKDEKSL